MGGLRLRPVGCPPALGDDRVHGGLSKLLVLAVPGADRAQRGGGPPATSQLALHLTIIVCYVMTGIILADVATSLEAEAQNYDKERRALKLLQEKELAIEPSRRQTDKERRPQGQAIDAQHKTQRPGRAGFHLPPSHALPPRERPRLASQIAFGPLWQRGARAPSRCRRRTSTTRRGWKAAGRPSCSRPGGTADGAVDAAGADGDLCLRGAGVDRAPAQGGGRGARGRAARRAVARRRLGWPPSLPIRSRTRWPSSTTRPIPSSAASNKAAPSAPGRFKSSRRKWSAPTTSSPTSWATPS